MINPTSPVYVYNEKSREKKMAYFRRFWVKEPRHSETIFGGKLKIATTIVACVSQKEHLGEKELLLPCSTRHKLACRRSR